MARYRQVQTSIWDDDEFLELSTRARLRFLHLLTSPEMTLVGACRMSLPQLAANLRWTAEEARQALTEASEMVRLDERKFLLWLPRFFDFDKPSSSKTVGGWTKAVAMLPEASLKLEIIQSLLEFSGSLAATFSQAVQKFSGEMAYRYPIDAPSVPHEYPNDTYRGQIPTETETEMDMKTDYGNGRRRNF